MRPVATLALSLVVGIPVVGIAAGALATLFGQLLPVPPAPGEPMASNDSFLEQIGTYTTSYRMMMEGTKRIREQDFRFQTVGADYEP
ncbi:MAG: hypothetical protein HYT76_03185 [Deltaproteobacteria bacterium]|nr:hypothetical protein [Deltaproteobacteria bacterium]